jgi:cytochrome c oxidase cbb3-type subunit 3
MGESIFLVQCAPCHGTTGDGLSGKAQDFSARMSKEQVLYVIKNGQNQLGYPMGAMPAGMASGKDAEDIAAYIAGGMKGEQPASFAACASCHGADGKGNDGMAPNLAAYDGALVSHVIEHGKKGMIGRMPSFKTTITPVQEKALTEYLQSLSR